MSLIRVGNRYWLKNEWNYRRSKSDCFSTRSRQIA